ncbi:MAG: hypothetical protein M1837_007352 [Sclerophora amabilis]|nr:MAG: hypothetical protein M1837_007352 [Sclerophora amabilis]
MVGLAEAAAPQPPGLGFSVSHQKVELEVDFATRSLKGTTEITINPHHKELKSLRLNCRQCVLKRLNINGRGPTVKYQEPYARFKIHPEATVHQYHQLRQRLSPALKEPPEEELLVNLPKSVHIEELDPLSSEAQSTSLPRAGGSAAVEAGDTTSLPYAATPRSAEQRGSRFTALTLHVEYTIDIVRDGFHFVGCEEDDPRYPHAYTRNSMFPGSACCLFPCVDDLSSRCTWEISIKCPRTLGDALRHSTQPGPSASVNGDGPLANGTTTNATSGDHEDLEMSGDDALEMSVVCSGDMTDEVPDPLDNSKKTASFVCSTAVAPQNIAFAVGIFEHVNLSEFRETDEDDKLGRNAIPIHGFCLPGRVDEVRNTCLPMAKAVDYFTLTYGSYPFSSYKLCFVDDLVSDVTESASLSVCSNRLLFPQDILEPLDRVTRQLVHTLASQWIGIDIIPKDPADMWVIVGISHFMTDLFMKKLSGNNEYRFRQKKLADRVCEIDVGRPSLYVLGTTLTIDQSEMEFIALKAPLVLYILDRRLAKASGSSGLSRIISRLFLNAKVGELANGALNTPQFLRTCEKLGHTKLESFFQQWVYGAGCPRFYVTQRFNKKKMVVEMLIKQIQSDHPSRRLETDTFLRDVKEEMYSVDAGPTQAVFTVSHLGSILNVQELILQGPMTIRIHEADGTPYEHIVEIKDGSTKIEIPYNTKYKRLKRSKRQKERAAAAAGIDVSSEAQDDVLLYCLGDVLQSEEEVNEWRLVDWTKDEEDKMNQESYEWIRMDADFEWICKMTVAMPGYMYLSQLQQDRDVVAQYESIEYIAAQRETKLVSTILVRTLMDRRYFHGIRTAAAHALAKSGKDELDWIGLFHLEKAFQEFFCFPGSPMPRSNDFSDRTSYYIQCAIPQALSRIRDNNGKVPLRTKRFLLDILKFNDNTDNTYSDCHYVGRLMTALSEALIQTGDHAGMDFGFDDEEDDGDEKQFQDTAIDQIDRYRSMDEWISSYQNTCSTIALDCNMRLAKAQVIETKPTDFLQYSREGTFDMLRLQAFRCTVELGLLKNDTVLKYFLYVLGSDPSPYVRENLQRLFGQGLAAIAFGEDKPGPKHQPQDGLVIEQETSTDTRQIEMARTQTVAGALEALKAEMGTNEGLKKALWEAATSPAIGLFEMRDLLDICSILYQSKTSMTVRLLYPRYWKVVHQGKGKMKFSWKKKIRTKPIPPLPTKAEAARRPPAVKKEASTGGGSAAPAPRLIFKAKKPPRPEPAVPAAAPTATSPATDSAKPRLTLKLKVGGAGSPR